MNLLHFIKCLETSFGKKADINLKEMIPRDIVSTWADTDELETVTGHRATTNIEDGVDSFAKWYLEYNR